VQALGGVERIQRRRRAWEEEEEEEGVGGGGGRRLGIGERIAIGAHALL